MRGSCILSASFLVVIAGMTTKPLLIQHPQLDVTETAALTSQATEPTTLAVTPLGPQPLRYYHPQKPVPILADTSHTRRVKLHEVATSSHPMRTIKDFLPLVEQFLATFSQMESHSWAQVPYFKKYGYEYDFANEEGSDDQTETVDFEETKTTVDETLPLSPRAVPDFVSNPIDETIGPAEEEVEVATEGEDTTDDSWLGYHVTASEWFGFTDETNNEEGEEEKDRDPYGKEDTTYRERYGIYDKDYAIEYETYEEELGEETEETTETANLEERQEQGSTENATIQTDINYEPLHEEADYYYESQIFDDEISPSTPNGSFDIYWEATDPNQL